MHSVCHHFISSHLPLYIYSPVVTTQLPVRKSALKQKDYEIRLSEVDLKDKDYFSTEITRSQIRKRKDHLEKILKPTDDAQMQESFSDQ